MPDTSTVVVVLVGLTDRQVHLKDGRVWPIIEFFGPCGEALPDHQDAVTFVAGRDGEGWIMEEMRHYQTAVMQ